MGADKNNLEYAGSVFTPCFATTLTSATLNQPLWLNLNYPLLPVFTNPSTFPQYQVSERIDPNQTSQSSEEALSDVGTGYQEAKTLQGLFLLLP